MYLQELWVILKENLLTI